MQFHELMWLWVLSIFCLAIVLKKSFVCLQRHFSGRSQDLLDLQRVVQQLTELAELIRCGIPPDPSDWEKLKGLVPPWGRLSYQLISQLRERGAAVLPTLERLKKLAQSHNEMLRSSRAHASQAMFQISCAFLLVPIFGIFLYYSLPQLVQFSNAWWTLCLLGLGINGLAWFWLTQQIEAVAWGGMQSAHRHWILYAQCAGEQLFGFIHSGDPPDLSWSQVQESLVHDCPELSGAWGRFWESVPENKKSEKGGPKVKQVLLQMGSEIRKALQVSLMEGQSCSERLEGVLEGFRQQIHFEIRKQLSLLPSRALKPLFFCVAPSVVALLAAALFFVGVEELASTDF